MRHISFAWGFKKGRGAVVLGILAWLLHVSGQCNKFSSGPDVQHVSSSQYGHHFSAKHVRMVFLFIVIYQHNSRHRVDVSVYLLQV